VAVAPQGLAARRRVGAAGLRVHAHRLHVVGHPSVDPSSLCVIAFWKLGFRQALRHRQA
jgi:hypothetical protein